MPGDTAPLVRGTALTDAGRKRTDNQDAVARLLTPYGGIFLVADGMGGHRTGELASRLAVERIVGLLKNENPSPKKLLDAFEDANQAIYAQGQSPESRGMGTTSTALWLDLPYALIAHVGDSRAYVLRNGRLMQLTRDHSWVAERLRQGLLTEEEAKHHQWRNVITNALGSYPQARVDLVGVKVQAGDIFLLCSDGLSGVLEDKVLAEVLQQLSPEEAGPRLVQLANEWGGPDNISVVIAAVGAKLPQQQRPYALPLETAPGPIQLKASNDDETLSQPEVVPTKPKRNLSRRDLWLLLAWVFTLAVVVYFIQHNPGPTSP